MRYCTFFFLLCGLLCCSSKLLQTTISSSGFLFPVLLWKLCLYSCFTVFRASAPPHNHQRVSVQVRLSCLLCIQYGGMCTSHEMYIVDLAGWMECTVLCKSTSVFVLMRDVFTIGRFWTIGPTCLLKQRYFSTGSNSCSSLYGMLYNTFFAELSLRRDEQHTLCTIV